MTIPNAVDDATGEINGKITEIEGKVDLKLDADTFNVTVEKLEKETIPGINDKINTIENNVSFKLDASAVDIVVEEKLANGIDKVETATGYRFDADGLNISKAGEEMTNLLDNTGMYVNRSGENILTANNKGVEATNLHAKTYLIIGSCNGRSRIEDYETNRTGVFWIG